MSAQSFPACLHKLQLVTTPIVTMVAATKKNKIAIETLNPMYGSPEMSIKTASVTQLQPSSSLMVSLIEGSLELSATKRPPSPEKNPPRIKKKMLWVWKTVADPAEMVAMVLLNPPARVCFGAKDIRGRGRQGI